MGCGWLNRVTHQVKPLHRQQSVVFLLHHRVALAGAPFECRAVEHRDATARVADQAGLLQLERGLGDAMCSQLGIKPGDL